MSHMVVMTFNNMEEAGRVRNTLRELAARRELRLDDAAVLVRGNDDKVHLQEDASKGAVTGAVIGGLMGLVLTFMFPVVGVLFGVAVGGVMGRLLDSEIDRQFLEDVRDRLQPGTSALFVLVRLEDTDALLAALRPYKGQVYQTTLSPELEDQLRTALQ